jgi:hypothetical protein
MSCFLDGKHKRDSVRRKPLTPGAESSRENCSEKERGIKSIRDWTIPFCFGFFLTTEGCAQNRAKILQLGELYKHKSRPSDDVEGESANSDSSARDAYFAR